ncbi:MAG: cyclase family protein [Chloroflexota bacterium]
MAKKFYDLTVPVGFMTPDWMGHEAAGDRHMERVHRHEVPIAPGVSRQISVYLGIWHKGTHFDGQTHHVEGGISSDRMPLESFYGTGVILDFRYMKKWDIVTAKDLENAKPKVQPGDVVLMNTGWHHYWRVNDYIYYNHYPGMYTEAGEWLLKKKVKMLGGTWGATDSCLAHYPLRHMYPNLYAEYVKETGKDPDKEFPDYEPCHQICSTNMIPALENVGGDIDKVTGKRCTIAAFPFRLPDAGHMVRVVAIVDE